MPQTTWYADKVNEEEIKNEFKTFFKHHLNNFPPNIRDIISRSILAGGVISSLINNEPINDWDIFIPEADVKEYKKYILLYDMSYNTMYPGNIQLNFMITRERHWEDCDFIHNMWYYDIGKDELVLPERTIECIINKKLIWNNTCSLLNLQRRNRIQKFLDRGWTIDDPALLKNVPG